MGDFEAGVAHLPGLLPEDGPQQALLWGQLRLSLGSDLAHQHIAGADLGAGEDDALLVEVGQDLLRQVRDVPGDLLGTELGIPGIDLVLVDVDGGEHVIAHQPIAQDDGVFEVVALPGHERHQQVLAQGNLAVVGGRSVGQDVALAEPVARVHQRLLVNTGVLVGPLEFHELELGRAGILVVDRYALTGDIGDRAVFFGDDHVGGVPSGLAFDAGSHKRRLWPDQGHGLALHVGAHESPVGVVMLKERDERRGHRDDLLGGDVHELDLVGRHRGDLGGGPEEHLLLELSLQPLHGGCLGGTPNQNPVVDEPVLLVEGRVGLGHHVLLFVVGGQPDDLIGDLAVDHLSVGRLDETELVDPSVGGQRADQADVGALGSLDGAHPAVMGEVDVAHLEAGPLSGQPARTQSRQTAAVGEPRQGVHLIHELGELAGAEELLDGGGHRPVVDEGRGSDGLDVLGGHALSHHPLHAGEADADLVLDQFAHRADAAVGKVVLVIEAVAGLELDQMQKIRAGSQYLRRGEHRLVGLRALQRQAE